MSWKPPKCACGKGAICFTKYGEIGFCRECLDKKRAEDAKERVKKL